MTDSYEGNERLYWDERIRAETRHRAIGRRSLPEAINRYRKERLFEVIDRAVAGTGIDLEGARVLDAGCGTGVYTAHYRSRGAVVVGVDLSYEGLRSARAHEPSSRFCAARVSSLPFCGPGFDLVHVFSVLYHVVDDREWRSSLQEIAGVVRPGGVLIMRIEWVDRSARVDEHVRHRARGDYLRILADEHGFELVETHSFRDVVRLQPLWMLAHRILPSTLSEPFAMLVERFDLVRENRDQKVVVFRKGPAADASG